MGIIRCGLYTKYSNLFKFISIKHSSTWGCSALSRLRTHVIQILQHLNLHQLQQLLLTLIIKVVVYAKLIHDLPYFLLIPRVELYLVHIFPHVYVYHQERLIAVLPHIVKLLHRRFSLGLTVVA